MPALTIFPDFFKHIPGAFGNVFEWKLAAFGNSFVIIRKLFLNPLNQKDLRLRTPDDFSKIRQINRCFHTRAKENLNYTFKSNVAKGTCKNHLRLHTRDIFKISWDCPFKEVWAGLRRGVVANILYSAAVPSSHSLLYISS